MKLLFWILVIGSVLTAATALFGYNEFSIGSSGTSAETATAIERIINAVLSPVFAFGAYGIKKKKDYGWWFVTILYFLVGIGFLANIRFGFNEGIGFLIWMVVSQIGCAALTYYFWLKWWKPKWKSYFMDSEAEPVAGGDATR